MKVQLPFPRAPVLIFPMHFFLPSREIAVTHHFTLGVGAKVPYQEKTKSASQRAFSFSGLKTQSAHSPSRLSR